MFNNMSQVGNPRLWECLQHVFGNILQCGSDSLLEFFNVSRKRGDIDESFHISPEEKITRCQVRWSWWPFQQNSSRESLPHWRMLPKTCCSVFGTSLITDLTCAESQAALILNICENYEIGHRIYKSLFFFSLKC